VLTKDQVTAASFALELQHLRLCGQAINEAAVDYAYKQAVEDGRLFVEAALRADGWLHAEAHGE
jgi:hypothetical protein